LKSATANIQLGSGTSYTVQAPTSTVGAVYSGLVLGVRIGDRVVKPLAERWPDAKGTFSFTLPPSARGRTLTLWENVRQSFAPMPQRPGSPVDLSSWPSHLGDAVPSGLATLKIPRG
jgi:hypothetical protein